MKAARSKTGASEIIVAAERAYAQGSCLRAGKLIDDAYRKVGMRRLPARLHRLDEKFESTCVRKHPKKGR